MSDLWLLPKPLVLASQSVTRRALLEAAGIPLEIAPAAINERAIESRLESNDPEKAAAHLAIAKANSVSADFPGRLVLSADQTLSCEGRRFSKPANRDSARAQLQALRGRTHMLHSAFALCEDQRIIFSEVCTAKLTMRDFSDAFLEHYLDTAREAVTQSVGAYQIEHSGIHLFEKIDGDHSTILGLPMLPLLEALREHGSLSR